MKLTTGTGHGATSSYSAMVVRAEPAEGLTDQSKRVYVERSAQQRREDEGGLEVD